MLIVPEADLDARRSCLRRLRGDDGAFSMGTRLKEMNEVDEGLMREISR